MSGLSLIDVEVYYDRDLAYNQSTNGKGEGYVPYTLRLARLPCIHEAK